MKGNKKMKYKLTDIKIEVFGRTLFRIEALESFENVKKGELGGYVENQDNLSQDGDAWVCGNARVYGDAEVYGDADYLLIGPIGSRKDFTTFFKTKDNDIYVRCGCFRGNIEEFTNKVEQTHKDNYFAKEYKLAIELAKLHIGGE